MVPVGGIPLLERLVISCRDQGIDTFYFSVHHLHEQIRHHFGDGSAFSVCIKYLEESSPMGSAGILHRLENHCTGTTLVLNADVLAEIDWQKMEAFHADKKADITLLVHPNDHPHDSDLVVMDKEDKVTALHSKPHPTSLVARNCVNAGAYLLEPLCFSLIPKDLPTDFGKDLLPKWCQELSMFGYSTPEYIKDMGTPERLKEGEEALLSGRVQNRSLHLAQKAIFLDRDGVINEDTDLIHRVEDFHLFPWTASALRRINKSDYLSIVVTNQSAVARGLVDEEGLNVIHSHMDTRLGKEGAFVDALYYCPHHPHGGFPGEVMALKKDCACRKPKPGMLLQAADRFRIDFSDSWMVGDSERDVLAGRAASVTTVGVRTGHGSKNKEAMPEFLFDHLGEAVDYILDQPFARIENEFMQRWAKKTTEEPFVISIGGQARSGKSTLAAALARKARRSGIECTLISLDHWIRAEKDRTTEEKPWDAYPYDTLRKNLEDFLIYRKEMTAPGYALHPNESALPHTFRSAPLVIIEGVVALSFPFLRESSHWTLAVETSVEKRKKRFLSFMDWRNRPEETESLWQNRLQEEVPAIEKGLIFAETHLTT